jgi:uncharacterized RDD family membrane protein YckC
MWGAEFDSVPRGESDYYRLPPVTTGYADWLTRVLASLLDGVVVVAPLLVGQVLLVVSGGSAFSTNFEEPSTWGVVAYGVGVLAMVALGIWNILIRQGRTGQSLAKSWIGIKIVREADQSIIGVGATFLRQLAHILDALPCFLGYLWPLWDAKRQTFADKIMGTVVIST